MPRATSEKINQRVIANKQTENIRWKSKTYPSLLSKRKWESAGGKEQQMGQIETNSKMEDLNSTEDVVK